MPIPFEWWLIENYGFDIEKYTVPLVPVLHRPPEFIDDRGYFSTQKFEEWKKGKIKEWMKS